MPIDRKAVQDRLKKFDFSGLFTQELGWDWHTSNLTVTVDKQDFNLLAIAHKRGLVAYQCPAPAGGRIPEYAVRRNIEQQVTKSAHEHLVIFTDPAQTTQIWHWVKRKPGKPAASKSTPPVPCSSTRPSAPSPPISYSSGRPSAHSLPIRCPSTRPSAPSPPISCSSGRQSAHSLPVRGPSTRPSAPSLHHQVGADLPRLPWNNDLICR